MKTMINCLFILAVIVSSFLLGCQSPPDYPPAIPSRMPPSQDTTEVRTTEPYVLAVGDELTIKVWGFDDLEREVTINNTGEIYYPLLGRVKLAGLTVPEARELMNTQLSRYIQNPQLELATTTNRQQIYVFGEVNDPQIVSYSRPMMVLEAISQAGWFNLEADRKTVLVVRRADNRFRVFAMDTSELFQDGSKAVPVYLQSGDLVYVGPKKIVDIERFARHLQGILQPIITFEQAVVLIPAIVDAITWKRNEVTFAIPTGSGGSQ